MTLNYKELIIKVTVEQNIAVCKKYDARHMFSVKQY